MNTLHFFTAEKSRKFESDCSLARSRVRRAETVLDVVRASRVHEPSELRGMHLGSSAKSLLASDIDRKLGEITDAQLAELELTKSADECKAMFGRFMMQEWQHLRGPFASQYRKVDGKGHRILFQKQKLEPELPAE